MASMQKMVLALSGSRSSTVVPPEEGCSKGRGAEGDEQSSTRHTAPPSLCQHVKCRLLRRGNVLYHNIRAQFLCTTKTSMSHRVSVVALPICKTDLIILRSLICHHCSQIPAAS